MKSFLFTGMFVLVSLFVGAQEIEVPNTQIPLITKISASWCPHCGGWGWSFFDGLLDDNAGKAILMTTHYSGAYQTDAGQALATNFGIVSQPEFFFGTDKISANSGNYSSIIPMVNSNVSSQRSEKPMVQSGLKLSLQTNGMLKVEAKVKFFENANGEYYMGLYLVENDFVGYQSGQGNAAQHKNIFRASLMDNTYGDLLGAGMMAADSEMDMETTFDLNATALQAGNIEIIAIIWEKVGTKYEYVNANSSKNIQLVSANEEVEKRVTQFTVAPNPVEKRAVIELDLANPLEAFQLKWITLDGKTVQVLSSANSISAGNHRFEIERPAAMTAGVYLLQLTSAQGTISKKILIQ